MCEAFLYMRNHLPWQLSRGAIGTILKRLERPSSVGLGALVRIGLMYAFSGNTFSGQ